MSRLRRLKGWMPCVRRGSCGRVVATLTALILGSAASAHAGLDIIPIFDSSITSDPNAAAIMGVINSAIQEYEIKFADPITVNIEFHEITSGLGQSSAFFATGTYSAYRDALQADATTSNDAIALAHLAS